MFVLIIIKMSTESSEYNFFTVSESGLSFQAVLCQSNLFFVNSGILFFNLYYVGQMHHNLFVRYS